MILEYFRTRGDATPPSRANPSDAGLDVHFSPDDGELKGVHLEPGESKLFSTGLKFGVPHGYMLEVKNRSGNASKRSLLVGACVIDSGYDGEVFVNLHNVGLKTQFIYRGMKIAQIVMVPVVHFRALETTQDNLYNWYPITMSDRGDGALGSTDKQIAQTGEIDYFGKPIGWELGDKL
jgi:dUTP pyrophosphatase